MTETTTGPTMAAPLVKVLTTLAELGEATAAGVAERAEMAYPTTTPKLRRLEDGGLAERFHAADRRTLWRLTETGKAAARSGATIPEPDTTPAPEPEPADATLDQPETSTGADGTADDSDAAADHEEPEGQPTPARDEQAPGQPPTRLQGEASPPGGGTDVDMAAPDPDPAPAVSDDIAEANRPQSGDDDSRTPASACGPTGGDTPPAGPGTSDPAAPTTGEAPRDPDSTANASGGQRRPKGALRGAVVDVLENHPDQEYKVGELCRLINAAEQHTGMPRASAGAVANALDKLITAGIAVQTVTNPATFQLAPDQN